MLEFLIENIFVEFDKKQTYETKSGEVYKRDGSTLKLTVGISQDRADQVRYLSL
jgi:hypothetical protein